MNLKYLTFTSRLKIILMFENEESIVLLKTQNIKRGLRVLE